MDRHIIRSWHALQHRLCTLCGRPWAVHEADEVDDYSVGFLTCTATKAVDAEQAQYTKRDESAHKAGRNPDRARQWLAWTDDEGPPTTT